MPSGNLGPAFFCTSDYNGGARTERLPGTAPAIKLPQDSIRRDQFPPFLSFFDSHDLFA